MPLVSAGSGTWDGHEVARSATLTSEVTGSLVWLLVMVLEIFVARHLSIFIFGTFVRVSNPKFEKSYVYTVIFPLLRKIEKSYVYTVIFQTLTKVPKK